MFVNFREKIFVFVLFFSYYNKTLVGLVSHMQHLFFPDLPKRLRILGLLPDICHNLHREQISTQSSKTSPPPEACYFSSQSSWTLVGIELRVLHGFWAVYLKIGIVDGCWDLKNWVVRENP